MPATGARRKRRLIWKIICGDESVRISTADTDTATDQLLNGLQVSWQAGECTGCQTLVLPALGTKVSVRRGPCVGQRDPRHRRTFGYLAIRKRDSSESASRLENRDLRGNVHSGATTLGGPDSVEQRSLTVPASVIANTVLLDSADPTECPDSPMLMAPTDGVRMSLSKPPFDAQPLWPDQVVGSTEGKNRRRPVGDDASRIRRQQYGTGSEHRT